MKRNQAYLFLAFVLVIIFFVFGLLYSSRGVKSDIYVWAWERPEDLRFLEGKKGVRIVYYAGDIIIRGGSMNIEVRRNKMSIPTGIPLIPLIRMDNFDGSKGLTSERLIEIKRFLVLACKTPGIIGCQIDFDAAASEYDVYTKLLTDIRSEIPKEIKLTATSLVSWCDKNSWLDKTVIDEAVPMFYRLGPVENRIKKNLVGETFMKATKCQSAVGISTDEPIPEKKYREGRDIYMFNPKSWTEAEFNREIELLK